MPPDEGVEEKPPRRGGGRKAPLTRGWKKSPPDKGGQGGCFYQSKGVSPLLSRKGSFSTTPPWSGLTPHRFACGLKPLAHRQFLLVQLKLTLKGGVVIPFSSVANDPQGGSEKSRGGRGGVARRESRECSCAIHCSRFRTPFPIPGFRRGGVAPAVGDPGFSPHERRPRVVSAGRFRFQSPSRGAC